VKFFNPYAQIEKTLHRLPHWQQEGATYFMTIRFDRLIRDANHFANCVRYIRRNPEKARLSDGEYLLHESELAKAVA